MSQCKAPACYPFPCPDPVVPGTDYCKRHNPDKKAKYKHPRVKCSVCGGPISMAMGSKWEKGRKYYRMMMAGALPQPEPEWRGSRENETEEELNRRFRRYQQSHEPTRWANWFKRRKLPPTCCLTCQRVARKKLNVPHGIPAREGCLVCKIGSARIGGLVCSKKCGIKLAEKALASQFSFEIESLERGKSDG